MKNRILLIFVFFILSFGLYCGLLEPENPDGSLAILLQEETAQNSLPKSKTSTAHDAVQCIVKKGSQVVYDDNLTKKPEGGFHREITGLEPANNYSVLLYGKNNSDIILSRAFKSDISVIAGEQSTVTLSWNSFTPALESPANGRSFSQTKPTFTWNNVQGVEMYELEVDEENTFNSPVIKKSDLTTTSFTAENPLADGNYYWHVRGKDAGENCGEWSDVFQFTISVAVLSVTPTALDFGSSETTKTFSISNTGTGTLTWNITDDSNWINVDPTSGTTSTETDQITVTVDRSNMASGAHTGTVSIISNNGTKTVSVSASKEVPDLSVSPQSLDFGSSETDKSFFIMNSGTGTLTWNVSDDKDWITVNPASGSTSFETDQLNVTVDRANLAAGIHTGTITVTSNGGTETISVTASKEVPDLFVSTTSLDFGSSVTNGSFNITNRGSGTLTWSVGADRTWINVDPADGSTTTETDPVSVTVDLSSLGAGTYTGTITVTSNGGTATISVTASKEVPDLAVSTNTLDFSSSETIKKFNISNIGNGTLTWDVGADKNWISVNPTSGSTT
ncbi:BACON domain-containing protein, partial [candidate division KSB1 bacterium]|nr:BACON domain-containing protein [candidate division KSB1 bacterium]